MTPPAMASYIISSVQGKQDATDGINSFYRALCEYVELSAQVFYSWVATNPTTGAPDPMVVIPATIKTTGRISPVGISDCSSALSAFSAMLNSQAALWQVIWPPGFALTPALVIPTIQITPSMATDMNTAWNFVCGQIIAGLKLATPAASGTHAAFVGAATFTSIL